MVFQCLEISQEDTEDDRLLGIAGTHAVHHTRAAPQAPLCQFFDLAVNDSRINTGDAIEKEYEQEWHTINIEKAGAAPDNTSSIIQKNPSDPPGGDTCSNHEGGLPQQLDTRMKVPPGEQAKPGKPVSPGEHAPSGPQDFFDQLGQQMERERELNTLFHVLAVGPVRPMTIKPDGDPKDRLKAMISRKRAGRSRR